MTKRHLFFLLTMLFSLSLSSQNYRLTGEKNAFTAGDLVVKQQVEYKDAGAFGQGIIWDFAFLQPINEEYEVKYFYPDSTDFSLICGQEPDARFYFRQSGDTLYSVGFENSTSIMLYETPELKLKFPFSFGDTLYSNFEGKGQYGRRVSMFVKGFTRVKYDATGTLKIPDFPDGVPALRTHSQRFYTQATRDSLQMKIDTWSWYVAGTRYPVFESIQTSVVSNTTFANGSQQQNDTAIFQTSFYYPPAQQTNIFDEQNSDNQILTGIYAVFTEADWQPNPVVENLYISYKLTRAATVWFSVHSNGSIPLCQTPAQNLQAGYNQTIIPMSSLPTGTYSVYVHVDDKLLFAEREKIIRCLGSFERTSENKNFMPKEVFKSVENINKTVVNQLNTALKKVESKMAEIISENEKLAQQMGLLTSIKGIGKFTAMYLIICTKGFEKFENWRQLACYRVSRRLSTVRERPSGAGQK